MAIEHADSFDIYGTDVSLMLDGVYADVTPGFGGGLIVDPDGISTQRCLYINEGSYRYPLQTPTDIVNLCVRVWMPALPASGEAEVLPFILSDIDNVAICSVGVQSNGAMSLRFADGVTAHSTNVPVVTAEAWWHLEARFDLATGEFQLLVENQTVLDLEGLAFSESIAYQFRGGNEIGFAGEHTPVMYKDLVISNDLGTDNTGLLGPVRVLNLIPDSDVTLGGWSPSVGTEAYPILANNPPEITDYMTGLPAAVGDPMRVTISDLPDDITSIKGVLTFVHARKIDGGYGKLQTSMVGTALAESPGADRPITAGYVFWRDVHERDPGTDAAWTRVGVNDAQIKIDRTL